MMLIKDGFSRQEDTLPKRYFREPVPEGPALGEVILREEFEKMQDEYYRLHGWDQNGVPKRITMKRLEIDK